MGHALPHATAISLGGAIAALTAMATAIAPSSALAIPDLDSVTTEAEIIAVAGDGGGGSSDRERSGRIGWGTFARNVSASDSNSDSGRAASAAASQQSRIVEAGDRLFGFDSQGTVSAAFIDPDGEPETEPSAQGDSEVTFGFDVVGSPVKFALTGALSQSFTPTNSTGPRVLVVSPSGVNHDSGTTTQLHETGELQPGSYTFHIEAQAPAFNPLQSSGEAEGAFDVQLRFCTDVISEPGGILVGTDEDDTLCGSAESDLINGRGGKDTIFGAGEGDGIVGGPGADEIYGEDGDDFQIYGDGGNDVIDAGPGDDGDGTDFEEIVAGGPGDDELIGGPGDDRMTGRCLDSLLGTPSPICPDDPPAPGDNDDDNLTGGEGDDLLSGEAGFNLIQGGPGSDAASAAGPSVFILAGGNDEATGSSGADCWLGGPGRDEVDGRGGNDKLIAKDGARDRVDGGPGPDRGRFDG